jgi:hypothetical protein
MSMNKNSNTNDLEYIALTNSIVDKYKETGDPVLCSQLIELFDSYFKKYCYLLCTHSPVDLNNKDTVKFLRFFMAPEERVNQKTVFQASRKVIIRIRKLFKEYTKEDMYNEIMTIFLKGVGKYKSMIANRTPEKERISFVHFIQVRIRFALRDLAKVRYTDIFNRGTALEYNDKTINSIFVPPASLDDIHNTDLNLYWVNGQTTGDIFLTLDRSERYYLFTKYNYWDKKRRGITINSLMGISVGTAKRKYKKIKEKLEKFRGSFVL